MPQTINAPTNRHPGAHRNEQCDTKQYDADPRRHAERGIAEVGRPQVGLSEVHPANILTGEIGTLEVLTRL